jgi:cephalosporin-C deacetylase-like acetyl esterase
MIFLSLLLIFARYVSAQPSDPFAYEVMKHPTFDQKLVDTVQEVRIYDINYDSPIKGKITAFLLKPSKSGKLPGILYLHLGAGNRATFLPEALTAARAGAICLLIDAPFARPEPWTSGSEGNIRKPDLDKELYVQTVLDLRRSLDLLVSMNDVDPDRLAYVGHSFGATWGGVLVGLDFRIRTAILMAGLPDIADFSGDDEMSKQIRKYYKKEELAKYSTVIEPLAGIHYVGKAKCEIFFQFADFDRYISKKAADQYSNAAPSSKVVKHYKTGHELNSMEAINDRVEWLQKHLNF